MGVADVTEAGIAEFIMLAEATPRRIAAATAAFDETRLSQSPAPEEWSALQILNHLRACEEVWMHSVYAMLAFENPTLKEIHPRQWVKTQNPYTTRTFADSLHVFTLRREALLITLRSLTLADWARGAKIDSKTHSVFSHVRRMVRHEEVHCGEIEALLPENS